MGLGIRELYTTQANDVVDTGESCTFVPLSSWDTSLDIILQRVVGTKALTGRGIPIPAAKYFWTGMMHPLLSRHSRARNRANSRLATAWEDAKGALGVEIPSISLCPTMTIAGAKKALNKLAVLKGCLEWQFCSPADLEVLREPLPDLTSPQAPHDISARWQKLSKNAQSLEYCQIAAGYLTGLVTRKAGHDFEVDLGEEAHEKLCKSYKLLCFES